MEKKNKKHYLLDDKKWLKDMRQRHTRKEVAQDLGAFSGSVTWAERVFTEEEKADFKFLRKPHKNTKR